MPENASSIHVLKSLYTYIKPYNGKLVISICLALILAVFAPVRPYLIQVSVDEYIANNLWQMLVNITIIQVVLLIIESLLRLTFTYITNWLGQTVVNDLRQAVFNKVIHQNLSYFDKTPIGRLTTRTINDLETINDVFSQGLISIIADVLTIIAIIVVMLFTDWKLTLVSLSVFPILIVATYFFKESVKKSFQMVRTAVSNLNSYVQEHITGMYIIQIFGVEKRELEKFVTINKSHRDANIRSILAYSIFFPVVEIILAMAIGLLVWYGAAQMMQLQVTQGVIIAFIMYLNMLFRPLRMLADKFNTLQMGLVAGERVLEVMESEDYLKENGTYIPKQINGDIVFKDVHFSYIKNTPVLRGISFRAKPGNTLALVGHTGAGKSSIINILTRLYEIDKGEILIDGVNLKSYNIYELRKKIAVVLQDVFLFSGSIRDNITLNNTTIPLDRIINVCKLIGIHEMIMKMPGGYDFNVMERGNTLSQGQKQLISFARALVFDPAVLVLDEATASVDSESEMMIQHAIDKMIHGRTSIVIAHRLSTIRKADKILVLEKGKIVEEGTHQELLDLKGIYNKMYLRAEMKIPTSQ